MTIPIDSDVLHHHIQQEAVAFFLGMAEKSPAQLKYPHLYPHVLLRTRMHQQIALLLQVDMDMIVATSSQAQLMLLIVQLRTAESFLLERLGESEGWPAAQVGLLTYTLHRMGEYIAQASSSLQGLDDELNLLFSQLGE